MQFTYSESASTRIGLQTHWKDKYSICTFHLAGAFGDLVNHILDPAAQPEVQIACGQRVFSKISLSTKYTFSS
jgi:hypothetical protein